MSPDAPDDEGFLSRWSRRKREQAEPEARSASVPEALADATPQKAEAAPAEPEPVEPPSLDLIDKDFDLAPLAQAERARELEAGGAAAGLGRAILRSPVSRTRRETTRSTGIRRAVPRAMAR